MRNLDKKEIIRLLRFPNFIDSDEEREECAPNWQFYGSLTFPSRATHYNVRRLLKHWMRELRRKVDSSAALNWIIVIEHCQRNSSFVYVLIGAHQAISKENWAVPWHQLVGSAAAVCDYRRGAFPDFISKIASSDSDFEIHWDMCGWSAVEFDGL